MNDKEEINKFLSFIESEHDCKCMDGTFEEFNKCCGEKFGIINPVETLFKMVAEKSKENTVPRLRDMEPEQAKRTLEKIFCVLDQNKEF